MLAAGRASPLPRAGAGSAWAQLRGPIQSSPCLGVHPFPWSLRSPGPVLCACSYPGDANSRVEHRGTRPLRHPSSKPGISDVGKLAPQPRDPHGVLGCCKVEAPFLLALKGQVGVSSMHTAESATHGRVMSTFQAERTPGGDG